MKFGSWAVCVVTLAGASAFAQPSQGQGGPSGGQPAAPTPEMKAAFEACKSQGKPGEAAFDACMTARGFKKPEGQHGGGHRPPPKAD
jgi:hypothetical protein